MPVHAQRTPIVARREFGAQRRVQRNHAATLNSSELGLECELKGHWRERVTWGGTWDGRAVWVRTLTKVKGAGERVCLARGRPQPVVES